MHDLDFKKSLAIWKSFVGFEGITFPSEDEYIKAEEKRREAKSKLASSNETKNESGNLQVINEQNKKEQGSTKDNAIENGPGILKFRATCNRVGKHEFTSMDAARDFGGQLQDSYHWLVDLTCFDLEVLLNINESEYHFANEIIFHSFLTIYFE